MHTWYLSFLLHRQYFWVHKSWQNRCCAQNNVNLSFGMKLVVWINYKLLHMKGDFFMWYKICHVRQNCSTWTLLLNRQCLWRLRQKSCMNLHVWPAAHFPVFVFSLFAPFSSLSYVFGHCHWMGLNGLDCLTGLTSCRYAALSLSCKKQLPSYWSSYFSISVIRLKLSHLWYLFSTLSRHLKMHSGEKSNKCNQCDYASSYASSLRTHVKTHGGQKLNKCVQCVFSSSQAGNLRTHLKIHSGEKLYHCL